MIRYVTRWALSSGIRKVDGHLTDCGKYFSQSGCGIFVSVKEAFETLDEAKAHAREMASKKAKNLRAQADKLSDTAWEPKVKS